LAYEVQTAVREAQTIVGKPLRRMEDPKFLTGSVHYLDDIELPDMLHACFVRSTYAHAKIRGIDVSQALQHPSVRLVLTAEGLASGVDEMPTVEAGGEAKPTHRHALAMDEANFVGEPIAVVVAEDAASAQEAAELVDVDYEPLPPVVDSEKALEEGSPKVHSYLKDNLAYYLVNSSGNIREAFREADHVIKAQFEFPRLNAAPLELRGIIASFDSAGGLLTAWVACQSPHETRDDLASILRLREEKVRVIVPDMGGGFGQKEFCVEYTVVCFAAMQLGRPLRWIESRMENLLAATQGRGQKQYVEAAVRKDGRIMGLKVKVICDGGAYSNWSISMPETTVAMSPGVYEIRAFYGEAITAFTNKTPIGAYRGASRPEAAYLIERTIDVIAKRLKLDPIKVRLKNFVPRSRFPYKSAGWLTYDSGDYDGNIRKAMEF
jgi:carbon-monoxide dehydrogenase large subunit